MAERLSEFDDLRAVAITGVLLIHMAVHAVDYRGIPLLGQFCYGFLCLLGRIGVPSFLLISGFFLTRGELAGRLTTRLVQRRAERIIPPYLIWSTFYFVLTYPFLFNAENGPGRSILLIFLEKLLLGNISWQLYFIVLLMQYYIFAALGLGYRGRVGWVTLFFFGLQLIFIGLCYVVAYMPDTLSQSEARMFNYFMAYRLSMFPVYIGYFLLGRWLGGNYRMALAWCRRYRLLLAGGVVLSMTGVLLETYILQENTTGTMRLPEDWMISTNCFILAALALILPFLAARQQRGGSGLAASLAAASFAVYLFHEPLMGYVIDGLALLTNKSLKWQVFVPMIALPVTLAVCLFLYWGINRVLPVRWARWLCG